MHGEPMAVIRTRGEAHLSPQDFQLDRSSIHAAATLTRSARFGDHVVVLRPPHLLDGPAWRRTCLHDADRLKPSFGSPDVDWNESVTLTAWADKVTTQRAAARAGRLIPLVLTSNTGNVLGEISFAIDPRSGVAELSIWMSGTAPAAARAWAWRTSLDFVLALPGTVRGVVAPVAVTNVRPVRMLTELGFNRRATAKQLRPSDGIPTDHDVWWLPRTAQDETDSVFPPLPSDRSPAAMLRSCAQMAVPIARLGVRRARQLLRSTLTSANWSDGTPVSRVRLPDGGHGTVTIDGAAVGVADVRHDRGSSTLEVWTSLDDLSAAVDVAQKLLNLADTKGVRRLAWGVLPSSVEQAAPTSTGLVLEGQTSPPVWAAGTPHELWARALYRPSTKWPPATDLTNPQPKESSWTWT